MKNLIVVCLCGKCNLFLESNGYLKEFPWAVDCKKYSTVIQNGFNNLGINYNEIPYSNGNGLLTDMTFNFGEPYIPLVEFVIEAVLVHEKNIQGVYFITELNYIHTGYTIIRERIKNAINRDIYKGDINFFDLIYSLGTLYGLSFEKGCNFLTPIGSYTNTVSKNAVEINSYGRAVLTKEQFISDEIYDIFTEKFKDFINLYDERKNIEITRSMFMAGFYGYIYENKEDDIVNIYQDRKIIMPFKLIKDFIDNELVPILKSAINVNNDIFTFNIPSFNILFNDLKLKNNFIISQDDVLLYSKMLIDFNNDISIKPYRMKFKDFIIIFGKNIYGRKSSEFLKKQLDFFKKAYIKNNG